MATDKTEQPTPKKLRDARQKGQVAQSQDVTSTLILVSAFAVVGLSWRSYVAQLGELALLPTRYYTVPFETAFPQLMLAVGAKIALLTLPVLGAAFVAALAGSFIQVGVLLSFESVMPKLEKLDPIKKLQQMFSAKGFIDLLKNILKTVFLGILLTILIRDLIDPLMRVPYAGAQGILDALGPVMKKLATNVALCYIVVAAVDYFLQKRQHIKQLMMSKDEVKREYKEMEGNPEIKGKRKQLHKELMMNDAVQKTRKASVLVTNPTHYAVALEFEEGRTPLPLVLAKGEGFLAQRMIEVAKEEGIPVMQNIPLAHALWADAPVDQYIPADLIEPVAEILRAVQELRRGE